MKTYTQDDIKGTLSNSYGIREGIYFKDGLHLGYDVRYTPRFHGLATPKEIFVEQVYTEEGGLLQRDFPSEEYKELLRKFIYDREGEWTFDESVYVRKGE